MCSTVFQVDTKGMCFLCFGSCHTLGSQIQSTNSTSVSGFEKLLQYLEVNNTELYKTARQCVYNMGFTEDTPLSANEEIVVKVTLCFVCSLVLEKFNGVYTEIGSNPELDDCVRSVRQFIKVADDSAIRVREYQERMRSEQLAVGTGELLNACFAAILRSEMYKKCSSKLEGTSCIVVSQLNVNSCFSSVQNNVSGRGMSLVVPSTSRAGPSSNMMSTSPFLSYDANTSRGVRPVLPPVRNDTAGEIAPCDIILDVIENVEHSNDSMPILQPEIESVEFSPRGSDNSTNAFCFGVISPSTSTSCSGDLSINRWEENREIAGPSRLVSTSCTPQVAPLQFSLPFLSAVNTEDDRTSTAISSTDQAVNRNATAGEEISTTNEPSDISSRNEQSSNDASRLDDIGSTPLSRDSITASDIDNSEPLPPKFEVADETSDSNSEPGNSERGQPNRSLKQQCPECKIKFHPCSVTNHIMEVHPESYFRKYFPPDLISQCSNALCNTVIDRLLPPDGVWINGVQCAHCSDVIKPRRNMVRHIIRRHESVFASDVLSYVKSHPHPSWQHMPAKRRGGGVGRKCKRPRGQCDLCGESFSSEAQLTQHASLEGNKTVTDQCSFCGYTASSCSLKVHLRCKHTVAMVMKEIPEKSEADLAPLVDKIIADVPTGDGKCGRCEKETGSVAERKRHFVVTHFQHLVEQIKAEFGSRGGE